MKNLFCIFSAIGNNYGFFTYQERLNQLLDSTKSIQLFSPGDEIIIIDASYQPLPEKDIVFLKTVVSNVYQLYDSPLIKWMGEPTELAAHAHSLERKTLGEIISMQALVQYLEVADKNYDRIFKLTGRFKLTSDFNKIDYTNAQGKVVILKREKWSDQAYPLRLWSFDFSQLNDIKILYQTILENTLIDGRVVEIVEKSMYKWINELHISLMEIDTAIGLEGRMGADGIQLYE
jgi:hypothetical protein